MIFSANRRHAGQKFPSFATLISAALVLVICWSFFVTVSTEIRENLSDPDESEVWLTVNDSAHYYQIAQAIDEGRAIEGYAKHGGYAHRQPLYPLSLALMMRMGGESAHWLAMVNVIIGVITAGFIYWAFWTLFDSRIVALLASLIYSLSRFIVDHVSHRLNTEPLYILFAIAAVCFALKYVKSGQLRHIALASAVAGLGYLTRPNGLFLMGPMIVALLGNDILKHSQESPRVVAKRVGVSLAVAFIIFAGITAPSWIPKTVFFGNPIYHAYLPNFMWVDTYEEGHVAGPPRYGPTDYFADHGIGDVVTRLSSGSIRVFSEIPISHGRIHYLLTVGGFCVALLRRRRRDVVLIIFTALTLTPLVWTALSNPSGRVHYGAWFPFSLFYISLLMEAVPVLAGRARPIVTSFCAAVRSGW